MNVGDIVLKRGFFTKALSLRMQPSTEVERRLGYRSGRLAEGWWLLFMLDLPGVDDFEVRGYTHLSGGVTQGHLPRPPDSRTAEQRLRDGGFDLTRIKQNLIRDVFTLAGPNRLAKAIPVRGEFGADDYPPGSGIAQWTLLPGHEKRFKVAAFIGPGQVYSGMYT